MDATDWPCGDREVALMAELWRLCEEWEAAGKGEECDSTCKAA